MLRVDSLTLDVLQILESPGRADLADLFRDTGAGRILGHGSLALERVEIVGGSDQAPFALSVG
jgi:hypothetical protein